MRGQRELGAVFLSRSPHSIRRRRRRRRPEPGGPAAHALTSLILTQIWAFLVVVKLLNSPASLPLCFELQPSDAPDGCRTLKEHS